MKLNEIWMEINLLRTIRRELGKRHPGKGC